MPAPELRPRAVPIAASAHGPSAASRSIVRDTVGSEATLAEQAGLDTQQRDVGQAIPAHREWDREIVHDLGRVMHRQRAPPARQHASAPDKLTIQADRAHSRYGLDHLGHDWCHPSPELHSTYRTSYTVHRTDPPGADASAVRSA